MNTERQSFGEVTDGAEHHIGFYLSDNFSMLPFVSAIEPLRIANRLSRKPLYQWSIVTSSGEPVHATNGLLVQSGYAVSNAPDFSIVLVCGPHNPEEFQDSAALEWLQSRARQNNLIGGIETGTFVLARAGLLKGVRCTTHWENIAELRELFPALAIKSDLYEIDGKFMTCAGGSAALDMLLYMIEQQHGHELAASVADVMIHPIIRYFAEPQRMTVQERVGINHPALVECIELMESNIEQPLSPLELSDLVGVSKRQLERLFRRYLKSTPARYYLALRLEAARNMLEKSTTKIIDVALACGFKSAGHFSSRYYSSFGETPRETRNSH